MTKGSSEGKPMGVLTSIGSQTTPDILWWSQLSEERRQIKWNQCYPYMNPRKLTLLPCTFFGKLTYAQTQSKPNVFTLQTPWKPLGSNLAAEISWHLTCWEIKGENVIFLLNDAQILSTCLSVLLGTSFGRHLENEHFSFVPCKDKAIPLAYLPFVLKAVSVAHVRNAVSSTDGLGDQTTCTSAVYDFWQTKAFLFVTTITGRVSLTRWDAQLILSAEKFPIYPFS